MVGHIPRLQLEQADSFLAGKDLLHRVAPDLVVMDFDLRDGYGSELLVLAKCQVPPATVFINSNHISCRGYFLRIGANAYFDKSMEFEALVELIRITAASRNREKE
jgi:DNA-binding NarL/FixJ family response regulator